MTTGEKLDANSTVSNVSALTHLINPSGEGGGLTINSEMILISEYGDIAIDVTNDTVTIDEHEPIGIIQDGDIEIIENEIEIGVSEDGIC